MQEDPRAFAALDYVVRALPATLRATLKDLGDASPTIVTAILELLDADDRAAALRLGLATEGEVVDATTRTRAIEPTLLMDHVIRQLATKADSWPLIES